MNRKFAIMMPLALFLIGNIASAVESTPVDDKRKSAKELKDRMNQSLSTSASQQSPSLTPEIDKEKIFLEAQSDLCMNIDGKQTAIPPGRFRITDITSKFNGWCVIQDINNIHIVEHEDMCKNIDGIQYVLPSGYFDEGGKQCFVDKCINLEGNQKTIPATMFDANDVPENRQNGVNIRGICLDAAKYGGWISGGDWCVNIEGVQFGFPPGTLANNLGECMIDKCLNIPGLQTSVPANYVYDAATQVCIPIHPGGGGGSGDGGGSTTGPSAPPGSGGGSGGGSSGSYDGP